MTIWRQFFINIYSIQSYHNTNTATLYVFTNERGSLRFTTDVLPFSLLTLTCYLCNNTAYIILGIFLKYRDPTKRYFHLSLSLLAPCGYKNVSTIDGVSLCSFISNDLDLQGDSAK